MCACVADLNVSKGKRKEMMSTLFVTELIDLNCTC